MGKKKESKHSSVFRSFILWFFKLVGARDNEEEDHKSSTSAAKSTGPVAAMVDASKHFSSAHKVRFN